MNGRGLIMWEIEAKENIDIDRNLSLLIIKASTGEMNLERIGFIVLFQDEEYLVHRFYNIWEIIWSGFAKASIDRIQNPVNPAS